MNHITPRREYDANRSIVYDDIAPPPPPIEIQQPQQNVVSDATLGQLMLMANILITVIIVAAMLVDGTTALAAIVAGSLYFTVTTIGFAVVTTGAMTAVVNAYQHERTERQRIEAYRELGTMAIDWKLAVEETRQMELAGRSGAVDPVQRLSPLNTYVAPFGDGEKAQVEGTRFAMSLYDTHGRPDARHVHRDGRLRGRMLGSKRGSGSRDAGRWLLRQGIIVRVRGGYALNVSDFPHRDALRYLL